MIKRLFHSFHRLEQLEKQRLSLLSKGGLPALLQPFIKTPIPSADTPLNSVDLVVLDFETSGLDPQCDRVLSVGMVDIHQQVVSLSTAQHHYLLQAEAVKAQSAVINHIMPETLTTGLTEQACIEKMVAKLAGKVVVVHGAAIEQGFIARLLPLAKDMTLPLVWLDTLMLEKSLSVNRGKINPDLSLTHIRQQKGLPSYLAHNALADAVATAELFLVLVKEIFATERPTLGPLVMRSLKGHS